MVADLVEAPPAATAYDDIKNRLVASHQLTDFQKAEKQFQMPALGSRKPSDLMAAMLETCPRGEEKSNLFACIFLQRLPREIRVLLANVDHKDPKALAARADELWTLHDNPGTSTSSSRRGTAGGTGGGFRRRCEDRRPARGQLSRGS